MFSKCKNSTGGGGGTKKVQETIDRFFNSTWLLFCSYSFIFILNVCVLLSLCVLLRRSEQQSRWNYSIACRRCILRLLCCVGVVDGEWIGAVVVQQRATRPSATLLERLFGTVARDSLYVSTLFAMLHTCFSHFWTIHTSWRAFLPTAILLWWHRSSR